MKSFVKKNFQKIKIKAFSNKIFSFSFKKFNLLDHNFPSNDFLLKNLYKFPSTVGSFPIFQAFPEEVFPNFQTVSGNGLINTQTFVKLINCEMGNNRKKKSAKKPQAAAVVTVEEQAIQKVEEQPEVEAKSEVKIEPAVSSKKDH